MKLFSVVMMSMALPAFGQTTSNYTSPLGVEIYNPAQLFRASGPWSMMSRAGDTLYISGNIPTRVSNDLSLPKPSQ